MNRALEGEDARPIDRQYAHPFYWSSLVLAGDGTRALYTAPERSTRASIARGLMALLAFAVVALLARTLLGRRRILPPEASL